MKKLQLTPNLTRIQFDSSREWLKARKGIGGSDASAILGLNPYKTNQELWMEKKGQMYPVDISDKPYVKYGNDAEPLLRALFSLDYPEYTVEYYDNNMLINKKYPWAHASLDGELIDGEGRRGILEIKTSAILQSMQWQKWDNQIPGQLSFRDVEAVDTGEPVRGYDPSTGEIYEMEPNNKVTDLRAVK